MLFNTFVKNDLTFELTLNNNMTFGEIQFFKKKANLKDLGVI